MPTRSLVPETPLPWCGHLPPAKGAHYEDKELAMEHGRDLKGFAWQMDPYLKSG